MADLDRLRDLTLGLIDPATAALTSGGSAQAWEQAMRQALVRSHTAAFISGTAERLGVPVNSPLISEKRLSRAERQEIAKAVEQQLKYLRGFAGDLDTMSDAQIAARARLYAGSGKETYWRSRTVGMDLPGWPAVGTQCKTNCGCAWEFSEKAARWVRGKQDSCPTCLQRERDWSSVRIV